MVPSLAGERDGGDDLFFTEILILSKSSEDISAHAQRIKKKHSQLQCKNCVCSPFWMCLFPFAEGRLRPNVCFYLSMSYVLIMLKKTFPAYGPLTPCIVEFSLCPCLSFCSHFTVCNLPLSRAKCSLHTHAFALVENSFCRKLSEADNSL